MSQQIKKKFYRPNSVDGGKVLFLNEQTFRGLKSDGTTEMPLFKITEGDEFKLLALPKVDATPTESNELSTKGYVDTVAQNVAADYGAADLAVIGQVESFAADKVAEEASLRSGEDLAIRELLGDEVAALQSALSAEEATRLGEDDRVLAEAKAYTDALVTDFGARFAIDGFVVDVTMIANNYIDLSHKAFGASLVASVGRLLLIEGQDFTLSTVGGVSRLSFIGSLANPGGEERLEVGDRVTVRYLKV